MNRRLLLVPCFLVACGDDGPTTKTPDAMVPNPDAARVCTALTAAATQVFVEHDPQGFGMWRAATEGMLPDGNRVLLQFEFYGGIEPSLAGTFDLTAGKQNNYETCAICVRGRILDSTGAAVKEYFQSAGSITLTEDPLTTIRMVGSITGLRLQEVTLDQNTFRSTPVANGGCADFAAFNVDRDRIPDAWTCTKDKYDDTANNCDCVCGASDPDCATSNVPATGCSTVGDVCYNDACVTPPVNDTCQMAIPIVVNAATATTGTTIGAAKNYNLGLQGATCTNSSAMAGADVAYAVVLTNTQAITVTLSGMPATYDGAIALLGPPASTTPDPTICDATPITTCVKGADAGNEGQNDSFTYTATADGTYYIIVDSFYAAQAGAFTLAVTSP